MFIARPLLACFLEKLKIFKSELIKRDKGTAYHSPYGIFAAYGPLSQNLKKYSNNTIETTQISPSILNFFNIEIPDYMNKNIL